MKPVIVMDCSVVEQNGLRYTQRANYFESVIRAGGLPLLLPPLSSEKEMLEALSVAHGVMLTGSDDIDPSIYGQERHEKTKFMHRRREKSGLAFAKLVYERDMPLLAICGGCQTLCIALGGTLIQHIPDAVGNTLKHFATAPEVPRHDVEIERSSRLFSIVGKSPLGTNSHHHQALKEVPPQLAITARAADGVIEAYEDPGKKFCLGVQWHPERMPGEKEHEALFSALVEAAGSVK
jgi:putative glutamine amidotransferase